jgi:predicted secreted protein
VTWVTGLATYFIIWWLVLFMALPFGVNTPDLPEPGMAASAPERPRLWLKAGATTVIAALIWGGVYALIELDVVDFRGPAE